MSLKDKSNSLPLLPKQQTMKVILDSIIEQKKIEVKQINCFKEIPKNNKNIDKLINQSPPFYISEYKRKSPSEGNIGLNVSLNKQIKRYIQSGTNAISVLTDKCFFGGKYEDLREVVKIVNNTDANILILQKDFIIHEKQIQQARVFGSDLILLIARILEPVYLIELKKYAESLGMGVLLEIHEYEEFIPLQNEKFNLIGINNRDLNTFKICLNRFNVIAKNLPSSFRLIAESGIQTAIDLSISKNKAHGFLVGTSLMRNLKNQPLNSIYNYSRRYFFKSCGLRDFDKLPFIHSDLIGVNFSSISKRKISKNELKKFKSDPRLVAVFKKNSFKEIQETLSKFKFTYAQIYSQDLNLKQFEQITCKKIFAFNPASDKNLNEAFQVAKFVDFFILDGSVPGSGKTLDLKQCYDFPYPFLLAGGMNYSNLNKILKLKHCIGVDIASAIESNEDIDSIKVNGIIKVLNSFH